MILPILHSFFSPKSNTLWVILKECVFSFQIFIGLLVINQFYVYPTQNYLRFLTQHNSKNAKCNKDFRIRETCRLGINVSIFT